MKKFFYLLLLVSLPMIFTSCSSEPESIIGKWGAEWVDDDGVRIFENIEFKESGNFSSETFKRNDESRKRGTYTFDPQTHILEFTTAWTSESGILLEPKIDITTAYLDGKTLKVVYEGGFTVSFKKK